MELFIPRTNRETVQRALNRGNALMVTVVEIDFAFAAERIVSGTCRAILSAAALWRSIGRLSYIIPRIPFTCSVPDNRIHPGASSFMCMPELHGSLLIRHSTAEGKESSLPHSS